MVRNACRLFSNCVFKLRLPRTNTNFNSRSHCNWFDTHANIESRVCAREWTNARETKRLRERVPFFYTYRARKKIPKRNTRSHINSVCLVGVCMLYLWGIKRDNARIWIRTFVLMNRCGAKVWYLIICNPALRLIRYSVLRTTSH